MIQNLCVCAGNNSCLKLRRFAIGCAAGFILGKNNKCSLKPKDLDETSKRVLGGVIAGLLVLLLSILIRYIIQNREKFRELIGSFLMNEVAVAVSLVLEIWCASTCMHAHM